MSPSSRSDLPSSLAEHALANSALEFLEERGFVRAEAFGELLADLFEARVALRQMRALEARNEAIRTTAATLAHLPSGARIEVLSERFGLGRSQLYEILCDAAPARVPK